MVQPKIIGLGQSVTLRLCNTAFRPIKLCLFPAYVNTEKMYLDDGRIIKYNSCPDNLNRIGYHCDQVAADYVDGAPGQFVIVTMDNGYSYDIFRQKVLIEDIDIKDIIVTTERGKDLKGITIELACLDEQRIGGRDYIKMQDYSLNSFTARFEKPFSLKKNAFCIITIPASAKITLSMNYEIVTDIKNDFGAIRDYLIHNRLNH